MKKQVSEEIKKELLSYVNPDKAAHYPKFFKTGPGEYGDGDRFIGVTVPPQRQIAKKYYQEISLTEIAALLDSPIHEHRLTALIMLTYKAKKASSDELKTLAEFYLSKMDRINNWDLIDISADIVLGEYVVQNPDQIKLLFSLAQADDLWQNRIAMLSCFAFIKRKEFEVPLKVAEMLLHHEHDLIHKAVGWMVREIGKKDQAVEEAFLDKHFTTMPRTMLRYAIEKFSPELRDYYLGRTTTKPKKS